jgi:hypothetical protein
MIPPNSMIHVFNFDGNNQDLAAIFMFGILQKFRPIENVSASNQCVEFRNEKALSCFGSELASGNGGFQYLHRTRKGRDRSPQAERIARLGSRRKTACRFMGWSYS